MFIAVIGSFFWKHSLCSRSTKW